MRILERNSDMHDNNTWQRTDLQSTIWSSGVPGIMFRREVQKIQLRTMGKGI